MTTRPIHLVRLACAALLLGACDSGTPPKTNPDMAAAPADMALQPPDLATPDLAPLPPVKIQLLDIADWHGQIDPLAVAGEQVGGAAVLSAYFKQERMKIPNTLTFTGGDSWGATPPLSAFFDDVPAIKALNILGIDANTLGNHNFDRGVAGAQALIDMSDAKFVAANLDKLAENLKNVDSPYRVFFAGGVKVAVIGLVNTDAPILTSPGSLGTMTVTDPVKATFDAATKARAEGAKLVIAVCHFGVTGKDVQGNPSGPLIDYAKAVAGVDVIFGDHTNVEVNQVINKILVIEAPSYGAKYARVQLTVDPNGFGAVTVDKAELITPYGCRIAGDMGCQPAVTPDPAVEMAMGTYRTMLATRFDTKIAVASDVYVRGNNIERLQEVPLGDLVTDAIRAKYAAQIAFSNSGGLRAPLPSTYAPMDKTLRRNAQQGYAAGPPYDLVIGDVFAVLPFGNTVVTRTVTGMQLWAVLERSVTALPAPSGGFLQISGFKFTYKAANPAGMRVQSVTLDDGTPILKDNKTYTAATNNFTNGGGDGYVELNDGQGVTRDVLFDVVNDYIKAKMTIMPTTSGRIVGL